MRGSSELHAWGDSNLYLRRLQDDRLLLSIEHRAAAGPPALALELVVNGHAVALSAIDSEPRPESHQPTPIDRVLQALADAPTSMTRRALRDACRMRAATVGDALADLIRTGRIVEDGHGFHLPPR